MVFIRKLIFRDMPRRKQNFQSYAKVTVWFRNGVKSYKLDTNESLRKFVAKSKKDPRVIKFVVSNVKAYVY